MSENTNKKIVLIDGHSILNRAFFGLPDLTNSEGLHTNAIYGFLTIMFKILDEEKPDYLTVAFDVHACPLFPETEIFCSLQRNMLRSAFQRQSRVVLKWKIIMRQM